MVIRLNGAASEVPDGATIQDIVAARRLPANIVVVELNGEIVRREKWTETRLCPEDRLEIVRLIGGG